MERGMFFVTGTNGQTKMVNRLLLEQLRMMMDWQLRTLGYDPESINKACRQAEGE